MHTIKQCIFENQIYSSCNKVEELPCKYFYLFHKQNDKNKESFECKHEHCKNVTFGSTNVGKYDEMNNKIRKFVLQNYFEIHV